MKLIDYIKAEFKGSQAKFANQQNVNPAQVTQWLKKDMIVSDCKLYSVRRDLNDPKKLKQITLYLRDYVGVDCQGVVPTVHLSHDEADQVECNVIELQVMVNQDWSVAMSGADELALYDNHDVHVSLICNAGKDGAATSVSAITAGKMFKLANLG